MTVDQTSFRLPHPLILLLGAVAVAAALTWTLPAGEYERRVDPATGRRVVVSGTFHAVPRASVGAFRAAVGVARGFVDAADVIALILIAGGAWFVVDRVGSIGRLVGALVAALRDRGLVAIPLIAMFFALMGALENMQEEIIPLVPALLVVGRGLGIDAITVVAMSVGAANVGSAFGPTNPFQALIAMKLAQLPIALAIELRIAMLLVAVMLWVAWTMRHAIHTRTAPSVVSDTARPRASWLDVGILLLAILPMVVYVYGSLRLGWGLNELSAGFLIAGIFAGLVGRLGVEGTATSFLEGMQAVLPAAVLVGVARSISIVLTDGRVIDTILHSLATPLGGASPIAAGVLMVPAHALMHVLVPSVSGQAVLTLPVFVPLSDLLRLPALAAVIAYQTGAGLMDSITPTNGALMAILLAAGVPYQRWLRFALLGVGAVMCVGIAGIILVALTR